MPGKTENDAKAIKTDLTAVRKKAQERMREVCTVNKVCDGAQNRFCQGQKYGQAIGLGGVGKGLAFTANVEALDAIKLKTRLVKQHAEPDLSAGIFGQKLSVPIMASSTSGVSVSMGNSMTEYDFQLAVLQGCKNAGTIGWVGNTVEAEPEDTGLKAMKAVGSGVAIFKPQSNERLQKLFKLAEKSGAVAVGVDLDGVGSTNWERRGRPVYRKSIEELRELAGGTNLPFIAKGIMSVEDARDVLDAGIKFIDVSNHGGRALDSTRGVAEVLPDIVKAVNGKAVITAGGGVRTGFDVLKMLALGAQGVLVGRDVIRAAIGGGPEGVKLHMDYMRAELRRAMLLTGCDSLAEIGPRVIDSAHRP